MSIATDTDHLLRQSLEAFQSVLKTGADVQERSARRFADALAHFTSGEPWHPRNLAVLEELAASNAKSLEESIHLMNEGALRSLELLEKAFRGAYRAPGSEPAARVPQTWAMGMAALRSNVQMVVEANARTVESWAKLVRLMRDETNGARG